LDISLRAPAHRERADRRNVNTGIGNVNTKIGMVNT